MKKVSENSHNPTLCPMVKSMKIIGGKWKLLIIYYLQNGAQRFSELQKSLPTITSKMLTQQLRELETDGVLVRTVYPIVPPKVEYSLSDKGTALLPIIAQLHEWGV